MCPWATQINYSVVRCNALSEDSGFGRMVHVTICKSCRGDRQSACYREHYAGGLRARLLVGELPRYQKACPIDVSEAFTKFRRAAGDEAAQALLKEMFYRQIELPENAGGLPAIEVGTKIEMLAKAHGMESVIEEIAREQDAEPARDSAANPL